MKNRTFGIIAIAAILVLFALCIWQQCQICKLGKYNILNNSVHRVPIDSLKRQIVMFGNVGCYDNLKREYIDIDAIENILPYALIMVNKFNYKPAYFDVYNAIQGIDMYYGKRNSQSNSLEVVDTVSRRIALEYLKKASEVKDPQAQKIIEELPQ